MAFNVFYVKWKRFNITPQITLVNSPTTAAFAVVPEATIVLSEQRGVAVGHAAPVEPHTHVPPVQTLVVPTVVQAVAPPQVHAPLVHPSLEG